MNRISLTNKDLNKPGKMAIKLIGLLAIILIVNTGFTNNYAQRIKLKLYFNDVPLKTVLKAIEDQSDFYFMYNDAVVNVNRAVSVRIRNKTIYEVLDKLLGKTGIKYEIINKQIVLTPISKINKNPDPQNKFAHTVTGTIVDQNGVSLPGANVVEKGTTNGTITDLDGKFTLTVKDENAILVFSYVGYETKEIPVAGKTTINVTLSDDAQAIEEVVVVGYGTSSKKLLTGSVGNVSANEIQETATYSIEGALHGKASGVQVMQNSGTPGSAMSIKVRGTASIYSGTQPLYVIDGVPMTTGDYSQIGYGGQGIDASMDINPNNIESITILKDASASSIYGARAANGVILITTKKGKAGKTKINYRGYLGVQKEWKRLDIMTTDEWIKWNNYVSPGFVDGLDPEVIQPTDWLDEVFTPALMMNHEVSVSGGSEKTQFYLSTGYLKQDGIVIGTGYEKFSLQANIDHKLTDKLNLKFRSGSNYSINNRVRGDEEIDGVLPNAISMPPIYGVKDDLGNYTDIGYFSNPVATANESTTEARTLRNISSLELSYRILPGLTIKNQFGADFYNLHERRIEPTTTRAGKEVNGMIIEGRSDITKITEQLYANYYKSFNKHNIEFLLGTSFEIWRKRYNYVYATNFPSVYPEYVVSAGTVEAETTASDEAINSIFSRIKYNYDNRYIFEFAFRRDGSSKFGTENKYAMLPAGSIAWRVIDESFMKSQNLFSDLKLKVSYGLTGNDQIGNNRYQNLYITGRNYYGQPGLVPKQIPNPELRWETTTNLNIGIDFELFNRITLNAEYYQNLTEDLLLPRPLPGSSGFTSVMTNVGSIENTGYEFTLNTINIDKEFTWNTSLNLSFNRNEVLELYKDQPIYSSARGNNAIIPGHPLGVFFIYESLGVDASTGDLALVDLNKDGKIDADDRQVMGNPNPIFTGGLTNIFSFKGFDLRVFFQFSYGNDIYHGTRMYAGSNYFADSDNQLAYALDQWKQPGDVTDVPRFGGIHNRKISTYYLEDGSYLRLKEATLGYNFPSEMLKRINGISGVRLYIKGQNLLTFTKYTGMDPEVNYASPSGGDFLALGTDFFTFPHPRVILFGINLDF